MAGGRPVGYLQSGKCKDSREFRTVNKRTQNEKTAVRTTTAKGN